MNSYDYDDIGYLSHDEVMERIRNVKCACVSYDDRHACARFRDNASWQLEEQHGLDHQGCECICHEIWHAWVASDYED